MFPDKSTFWSYLHGIALSLTILLLYSASHNVVVAYNMLWPTFCSSFAAENRNARIDRVTLTSVSHDTIMLQMFFSYRTMHFVSWNKLLPTLLLGWRGTRGNGNFPHNTLKKNLKALSRLVSLCVCMDRNNYIIDFNDVYTN